MGTKSKINALTKCVREFRKHDHDMPSQHIELVLLVATNDKITMKDIALRTGMSQASTSRAVNSMAKIFQPGKPGLGFLKTQEDPFERRRKIVSLTAKGEMLIESLVDIIDNV